MKFQNHPLESLSIRAKVIFTLSVPALVVVVLSLYLAKNTEKVIESGRWVQHTHEVIAQARHLEKQMIDFETGQRGYLLAGDELFLQPFFEAQQDWDQRVADLQKLVSDNPRQVALAGRIDAQKRRWMEEVALPEIEMRRQVERGEIPMADLITEARKAKGKEIVDGIRALVADFVGHEQQLIVIRVDEANQSTAQAQRAIIISAASMIAAIVLVGWSIIKSLLVPIIQLDEATKAVAAGDLEQHTSIKTQGRDEIATLGRSFSTMVDNLNRTTSELIDKADELEASSRYKSEFLANMSHEIRTPMNGIIGMAQLLQKSELDEQQREKVDRLLRSGETLLVILSEILDYSKIEANKIDIEEIEVDLPVILTDVDSYFGAIASENGITFRTDLEGLAVKKVIGDPHRLRQVINNLCSNAVKFTPEGSVSIKATSVKCGETADIEISVSDTGIGMDEAGLANLFTAFAQAESSTTRKFGGTGLGMTISKKLVDLMGGALDVTSKKGKGTAFTIKLSLPICEVDSDDIDDNESDFGTLPSLKCLVVDDNEINQELLTWMLEEWGHEVSVAENGLESVEAVSKEDFDAVFMDYHMPEMNGLDATRAIRKLPEPKNQTMVIGCTADAFSEVRQQLLEAGQNDVISKPILQRELHNALRMCVEAKQA